MSENNPSALKNLKNSLVQIPICGLIIQDEAEKLFCCGIRHTAKQLHGHQLKFIKILCRLCWFPMSIAFRGNMQQSSVSMAPWPLLSMVTSPAAVPPDTLDYGCREATGACGPGHEKLWQGERILSVPEFLTCSMP
jgi:hypothetical protein